MITTKAILEKIGSGMHFISLDKKTVTSLTKGGNKRVICKLNDGAEFHCAIMPKKEGGHFINIGLAICKKLQIRAGSNVTATFKIDTTKYQFEMPEELEEVLATDEQAEKIFHSLTAGNQRSLIYLVSQVKSGNKRIERALKIADKLKNGVTSARNILS